MLIAIDHGNYAIKTVNHSFLSAIHMIEIKGGAPHGYKKGSTNRD